MFKSVTLEMSLKPFKKVDDASIQKICAGVFEQWRPLIKNRQVVSIMLWTADGSEILDYTGDLDKEFEWCYFLGTANLPFVGELPAETSLHERKQIYIENPPRMTYRILQKIVAAIKAEGSRQLPGVKIRVGATFDIGPEFAISDFKYRRHKECCKGQGTDGIGFVDATALLEGDDYPYAAYPQGLPQGTPMGTLLGAQSNLFLRDLGFDYLWLSNGMGFSYEPWNKTGKIYDGEKFYPERLEKTREKVFLFWKLFREACPDYPIETRGTNYSVGIDYASDGVPLYDIYNGGFQLTPPPNSPWAAINDDVGIEVLGHLTRNCNLPGEDYMFRFYIHDIWWVNTPWYDRYEGNPWDIYIPMALSRIDQNGRVQNPALFNILSIDNSFGNMPDSCVYEPLPHILKAEKDAPDEAGPLVLVYPMREYTTAMDAGLLREMYFGDSYLQNAINNGFPLATVVSSDNFLLHSTEGYQKTILVVPAASGNEELTHKLRSYAEEGGKIIVYGSREALKDIDFVCEKVDYEDSPDAILKAMGRLGYEICYKKADDSSPLPTMILHRSDNALFFDIYNRDTTVETHFKFPLGAPVINGYDTLLTDGYATYRFPRSVHGECRVFVKQENGIVRAREMAPVNRKYRRKIKITGLKNADLYLFGENDCAEQARALFFHGDNDVTPTDVENCQVVNDPVYGTYIHVAGISGEIYLAMPFPDRM